MKEVAQKELGFRSCFGFEDSEDYPRGSLSARRPGNTLSSQLCLGNMKAAWGLWIWDLEGNWKAVGSRDYCANRLQGALAMVEDPEESKLTNHIPSCPED